MKLLKSKDLFNPIRKYWETIRCKDIDVFNETNELLLKNKLINTYNKNIDVAMYHSINYYDNINILLMINITKNNSYNYYIEHLKDTHILYGIKTLNIKFNILKNILYQIQYQYIKDYDILLKTIKKDYPFYEKFKLDYIEVNILILCNRKNNEIILNDLNDKIIYFTNDLYKKKVISSIFFNEKSLEILEKQNLRNILSKEYETNIEDFKKLLQIYKNYDHITQEKFLIFSSTLFMVLGIRKNNDIDLYIDETEYNYELQKSFEKNKIDYTIKNTQSWPSHWDKWLDEWANLCNAKYFEEILGFQEYHFYFCGIKITNLNVDIPRRQIRKRPASNADLIMLNNIFDLNIKIPEILDTYIEYKKIEKLSEKDKDVLLKNGAIYDEENREYKIERKTNKDIFLFKVKEYLKNRYNHEIELKELKYIFKIEDKIKKIRIKKNINNLKLK